MLANAMEAVEMIGRHTDTQTYIDVCVCAGERNSEVCHKLDRSPQVLQGPHIWPP